MIGKVGEEGESWAKRSAIIDDRLETVVVYERCVQDEINTGLRGFKRGGGISAVGDDGNAERVRGGADRLHLIEGPDLQLTLMRRDRTSGMDLDPVGTVFDLAPGFDNHLVDRVDDRGIADPTLVGDQPPGCATDRGEQRLHARSDSRTRERTRLDCLPNFRTNAHHRVWIHDRGDARQEKFGEVEQRHHCRSGGRSMKEQLVVGLDVVERDVTMGIDETRHDRRSVSVDHQSTRGHTIVDRAGCADRHDDVSINHDVDVRHRCSPRTVDE